MAGTPPDQFSQPKKKFRDAHLERFAIYVSEGIFLCGPIRLATASGERSIARSMLRAGSEHIIFE